MSPMSIVSSITSAFVPIHREGYRFIALFAAVTLVLFWLDWDALAAQLQDFVKQSIAPYKYPRAVEFAAALPRTETGKLQRFRLRQE